MSPRLSLLSCKIKVIKQPHGFYGINIPCYPTPRRLLVNCVFPTPSIRKMLNNLVLQQRDI